MKETERYGVMDYEETWKVVMVEVVSVNERPHDTAGSGGFIARGDSESNLIISIHNDDNS